MGETRRWGDGGEVSWVEAGKEGRRLRQGNEGRVGGWMVDGAYLMDSEMTGEK